MKKTFFMIILILSILFISARTGSKGKTSVTVTPRFMTVTNASNSVTQVYCVSVLNAGSGTITLTNTLGETMTIATGQSLSIGEYTSQGTGYYIDYLGITATSTTAKIVYYK